MLSPNEKRRLHRYGFVIMTVTIICLYYLGDWIDRHSEISDEEYQFIGQIATSSTDLKNIIKSCYDDNVITKKEYYSILNYYNENNIPKEKITQLIN